MPQIFHRSSNSLVKVTIVGGLILVAGVTTVVLTLHRTPYITKQHLAQVQPVPFSHEHHVRGLGIDCRYCHATVETNAFAGIPSSQTCMTCHSQIWNDSPMLEPVRESFRTEQPLAWVRVHDLPDFAYFNHSIHINKGVACATCHGPVERMPLMWRENTLNMSWCTDCHRNPERNIGLREAVFLPKEKGEEMLLRLAGKGAAPTAEGSHEEPAHVTRADLAETRMRLAKEYKVVSKMDCSVCHR